MTGENMLIFFLLAAAASGGALLLYRPGQNPLLYFLRAAALFFLLLFVWNPVFYENREKEIKPRLFLLVDASKSMENYFALADSLKNEILHDEKIRRKFDIQTFYFTGELKSRKPDTPGSSTDIGRALKQTETFFDNNRKNAVVIFTDGVHTKGKNYTNLITSPDVRIYPVVTGDTLRYVNLKIERVDYNDVVAKDNYFYIKAVLSAENTDKEIRTRFRITRNNKILHSENVIFSPGRNFYKTEIKLQASTPGIQRYRLYLQPVEGEKNIDDNSKTLRIEVTEKKASVLILTGKIHPDAGLFKRILSRNKSYSVKVKKEWPENENYDLIIAVQPQTRQIERLVKSNIPVIWLTGKHTDWNTLNARNGLFERKTSTNLYEQYFAYENPDFRLFELEKLPENILPPLTDYFGNIVLKQEAEIPYYSQIKSQKTGMPLWVIFPRNKQAAVFGQGLWRWYVYESRYDKQNHIEDLIKKTAEFLLSKSGTRQLQLAYKKAYSETEPLQIRIFAYNIMMQPDPNAHISVTLKSPGKKTKKIPVFYEEPFFTADLGQLPPGNYRFNVTYHNYNITKSGYFEVKPVIPEKARTANLDQLRLLAENTKGKLFTPGRIDALKKLLTQSGEFKIFLRQYKTRSPLTQRAVWLFLFVLSISAEWFYRKYRGML